MPTANAEVLPAEFLLHIHSKRADPWMHFVLVRKAVGPDGKYRLTRSPHSTILVPAGMNPSDTSKYAWEFGNVPLVSTVTETLNVVHFSKFPGGVVHIHGDPPRPIPILSAHGTNYRTLLGKNIRANFTAVVNNPVSPLTTSLPAPILIPSPSAPLSVQPPPLSTIEHVAPPKISVTKLRKTGTGSDLAPFVAKQLLVLAKLRHEECPNHRLPIERKAEA